MTVEEREELKRLVKDYGMAAIEVMVEATKEGSVPEQLDAQEREEKGKEVGCSFCGKRRDRVANLIAGPGVYICVECVALCNEIIAKET